MVLILLLPLAACGDDDNKDEPTNNNAELLIGKWYQSATWTQSGGMEEEVIDRTNWYITLTFEKNGAFVTEIREYTESSKSYGTYVFDKSNMTIQFTTSSGQSFKVKVLELKSSSLVFEIQNKKIYYIK